MANLLFLMTRGVRARVLPALALLSAGAAGASGDPCYRVTYDPVTRQPDVAQSCELPRTALIRGSEATHPVWQDSRTAANPPLEPTVTFVPVPNGYDLVFDYHNTEIKPRSLGEWVIDGIRFGEDVTFEDFRVTDQDDPALAVDPTMGPGDDFSFGESVTGSDTKVAYPSNWFAPVFVMGDSSYTLGVSVQYPLLDYKHFVRFSVVSDADRDELGRTWTIRIRPNPGNGGPGGAQYRDSGELAPGEQRQYRVTVRFIKDDPAWATTLLPYRTYFQSLYGNVDYFHGRDPRPVRAEFVCRKYAVDPCYGDLGYWDNSVEFFNPNYEMVMNPRVAGWRPWVDNLKDVTPALGYGRVLCWRLSGEFTRAFPCPDHQAFNNPFLFATHLSLVTNGAPGDTHLLLNEVKDSPIEFGMYWGRASQPMQPITNLDDWNLPFDPGPPATGMVFTNSTMDINNPAETDLAFDELLAALETGGEWFGLDAVTRLDPWDLDEWLNRMRQFCIDMGFGPRRFTTEPTRNDFLLVTTPAIQTGDRMSQPTDGERPAFLTIADLCAPGHEVYSIINGSPEVGEEIPAWVGGTEAFRKQRAKKFAAWGLIPLVAPANAIEDATPQNNTEVAPKPPISILIDDPDDPGGPQIPDPEFTGARSWQTNPALPDDPEVRRLGDVNLDGHCDMDDLMILTKLVGERNDRYDLTADGKITMDDIDVVMLYLNVY